MFAIPCLHQQYVQTGRLHRDRNQLYQTFRGGQLAFLHFQTLRFHHTE